MRACERVFSVGFGPGLDSMSPARSRHSASHAAGTHGWLPPKNWVAEPPLYHQLSYPGYIEVFINHPYT